MVGGNCGDFDGHEKPVPSLFRINPVTGLFASFSFAGSTDETVTTRCLVSNARKEAKMFSRSLFLFLALCVPAVCRADLYGDWIVGNNQVECQPEVGCSEGCGLFHDLAKRGWSNCGLGKCGSHPMWFTTDYLGWFIKGNQMPALVTTSPSGTPQANAGVLGQDTSVLFGNERIDDEYRSGMRLQGGIWLDTCKNLGLEFSYLSLFNDTNQFFASTESSLGSGVGLPILARPFFNAMTGLPDSELVSYPNLVDGVVGVATSSRLDSLQFHIRKNRSHGCNSRCDFLVGYRYLRFDENLTVGEHLIVTETGGLIANGTQIQVYDSFSTDNDFHGGQIGYAAEYWYDFASIELIGKLAVGGITRKTTIDGATRVTVPGGSITNSTGGLLALPSNIGTYRTSSLAVLPEFNANLKLRLTGHSHLAVGYSVMLLNDVARTGRAVDTGVNPANIPGATVISNIPRPIFKDDSNDFWVQGLNVGWVVTR